ncbi:MAG: siderophore ABC transporter substrate-binding protein [Promicromonosporaceae bacterium]|nr:siderophore ABC transporter substrate-binding protein [Promicromonosporaceae bacterium]
MLVTTWLSRRALALAVATFAALGLAACTGDTETAYLDLAPVLGGATDANPSIVIEHAQGALTFDTIPERVYALDWGVIFVLTALGVEVQGIPENLAPDALAPLLVDPNTITVGTLHEPCFETIAANPADLVIVASRSAAHFEELASIAPTIDASVVTSDNVAQSKAQVRMLGEIFGRQAKAETLIADFEATIAQITALTDEAGDALIVLTSGANVTAFGPGGRFGFLHDDLGFDTAALITEDDRHGQSISFEFVLEADPAWLFVIDRDAAINAGADSAQQVLDNAIIQMTRAYQNNRIVYVDTTTWYLAGTGIVSMQSVADDVLTVLRAGNAG